MSRQVQWIMLCEDRQQEVFARRFLQQAGWSTRRLRVQIAPPGQGSGEQFVRTRYPIEVAAYRKNRGRVAEALIVLIDGDDKGVEARQHELDESCRAAGLDPRQPEERIALFIPTWCIETWIAYLNGNDVTEERNDYPRLDRPRDCRNSVNRLYDMCQQGELRQPSPPALNAACEEYRTRLRPLGR